MKSGNFFVLSNMKCIFIDTAIIWKLLLCQSTKDNVLFYIFKPLFEFEKTGGLDSVGRTGGLL